MFSGSKWIKLMCRRVLFEIQRRVNQTVDHVSRCLTDENPADIPSRVNLQIDAAVLVLNPNFTLRSVTLILRSVRLCSSAGNCKARTPQM